MNSSCRCSLSVAATCIRWAAVVGIVVVYGVARIAGAGDITQDSNSGITEVRDRSLLDGPIARHVWTEMGRFGRPGGLLTDRSNMLGKDISQFDQERLNPHIEPIKPMEIKMPPPIPSPQAMGNLGGVDHSLLRTEACPWTYERANLTPTISLGSNEEWKR